LFYRGWKWCQTVCKLNDMHHQSFCYTLLCCWIRAGCCLCSLRVRVSTLLKIQLRCLLNVNYTRSTHVLSSDPFVAQLVQRITLVQHPAVLNWGVAALGAEKAPCQFGFAHSAEIEPNVILLFKTLPLVARNGCSSWGYSRISCSLPVMQHMTSAPGLHPCEHQSQSHSIA